MSPDSPADRYHRRRRTPILVVLCVLLFGGSIAWYQVLKPVAAASTGCNQPGPAAITPAPSTKTAAGTMTGSTGRATASTAAKTTATPVPKPIVTALGSFASPDSLTGVRPADPAGVTLQVFNASLARGQAKTVTNDLRAAGFTSGLGGTNDPLYPAHDLRCTSEIRYGQAGTAAARTVLLVAPCAQLVLDNRISDSVDLALGGHYAYAPLAATVIAQLKAIHDAAIPPAVIEGQTAAPRPAAVIPDISTASCH